MKKNVLGSLVLFGLLVGATQAAIMDTIIATVAYRAEDTDVYKFNADTLAVEARHERLWFDNITGVASLPDGNFTLIAHPYSPNAETRVHLMSTNNFNQIGDNDTRIALKRFYTNGPSSGGMSNRYGEIFAAKYRNTTSADGVVLNGLDSSLPVVQEVEGGYFDPMIYNSAGASFSNGDWLLAYTNGYEWRRRDITQRAKIERGVFDVITGVAVSRLDKIGLMNQTDNHPNGPRARLYSFTTDLVAGTTGDQGAASFYNQTAVAVTSLSNGDWVFATNSTNGGNSTLYILKDDSGMAVLNSLTLTGINDITCLAVQNDDDIIVGTAGGKLQRYSSSLVFQAGLSGLDPITHIAVLVPEPASLGLLGLAGLGLLRRKK